MLTRLIKEEALRTYLFTFSHVYSSISISTLAQMFQMEQGSVHSIISKMIINEELMVSASSDPKSNEKILNMKSGLEHITLRFPCPWDQFKIEK